MSTPAAIGSGIQRTCARAVTLLALLSAGATPPPAFAQDPPSREIRAVRLDAPVAIDGALAEAVWQTEGRTEFRRRLPSSGSPSQSTMVWVAFDDRALYVAVRCFSSQPLQITRTIGPRDGDLEADWVMVSLDAFHDRRSGFFFRVSPGGAIRDGVLFDDSRSDTSWDGVWEQGTAVDSLGWTAEIRIPFTQLRFSQAPEQRWGVNFTRRIHATNEIVDFTAPRPARGGNVSLFADLVGVRDIPSPARLEVLPYIVAATHRYEAAPGDPFNTGQDFGARVGADLKVGLGSGLTLDASLNPDFGHVEADPAVVNLTATETFYEEKRPFFLEGTHTFDFGRSPGLRFFHSRRIGRPPQGTPTRDGFVAAPSDTRIVGAGKMTGRIGRAWTVGWLNAVTAREHAETDLDGARYSEEIEPLTYYGVFRAQGSFREGGHGVGVFSSAVARDLREPALESVLNRQAWTGGVDGWWYLDSGRLTYLEAWVGASHVAGSSDQIVRQQRSSRRYFQRPDAPHLGVDSSATKLDGVAGRLGFTARSGRLTTHVNVRAISPGFEINDLGYGSRSDLTTGELSLRYNLGRANDQLNRSSVGLSVARDYDFGGSVLATSYTAFAAGELKSFWGGSGTLTYSPAGLDVRSTRGGASMRSVSGWSASLTANSDSRQSVLLTANADLSRDLAGSWSAGAGGELSWFPTPRLTASLGPWWGKYYSDAGYFGSRTDATLSSTYGIRSIFAGLSQEYISSDVRLDVAFTPKLSLHLYAQPYHTRVRYEGFKELARPGSYEFVRYGEAGSTMTRENGAYTVDPDGLGAARPFTLYDSDFRYSSLRGTTVLRWDYRPGSFLTFAWTHDRFAYRDFWEDWRANLLAAPPDDRLMVKLTYWFSP